MICPACSAAMTAGRFANHGQKWHLQAYGPFGLPLSFTPDGEGGGDPGPLFAGTRAGQAGFACPRCRTVVLLEPPPEEAGEDWECPACGERVPGKFATCWKCQHRRPTPEPAA